MSVDRTPVATFIYKGHTCYVFREDPVLITISSITGDFVIQGPPGAEPVMNEILATIKELGGKGGPVLELPKIVDLGDLTGQLDLDI
jgi:hypothetical protein